jgi:hypothetical protein
LAALAAPGDATQPNKLQFDAVRVPFKGNPDYWTQVRRWIYQARSVKPGRSSDLTRVVLVSPLYHLGSTDPRCDEFHL